MSEFFTEEGRKAWLEDLHKYGKSKLTEAEYGAINVDWWNSGIEAGAKSEQERIIKLLQEMQETALATGSDKGTQTGWVLENAIVLIKGENK